MKLTVSAVGGSVVLADPNPLEGVLTLSVDAGASVTKTVSPAQYDRLLPQLRTLSQKLNTLGTPMVTYSIADDEALDDGAVETAKPSLDFMGQASISVGTPDASVPFTGTDLLADQTKATAALSNGTCVVTAIKPGVGGNAISITLADGAAESVAVVGNDVTITLNTGVSTSTSVSATVAAHAAAKLLVAVTADVTVLVPVAKTYLAGGKGQGVTAKVAGIAANIVSITDTALVLSTPALTGVTATWPVKVEVITGGNVLTLTALTAA